MKEKKDRDVYKIATFVLLAILVLGIVGYFVNSYLDNVYEQGLADGQAGTVNFMLSSVQTNGFFQIALEGNQSLVMVPSQSLGAAQEEVINSIVNIIQQEGFVTITNADNQTITLVPLPPQQESNSN